MQTKPRLHVEVHIHRGARGRMAEIIISSWCPCSTAAKFYMDLGFRISIYLIVGANVVQIGTSR